MCGGAGERDGESFGGGVQRFNFAPQLPRSPYGAHCTHTQSTHAENIPFQKHGQSHHVAAHRVRLTYCCSWSCVPSGLISFFAFSTDGGNLSSSHGSPAKQPKKIHMMMPEQALRAGILYCIGITVPERAPGASHGWWQVARRRRRPAASSASRRGWRFR